MTSRTAALMRAVRQLPAFRQLIPQEAGVGWPLPLRRDRQVYLILPFFGLAPGLPGEPRALFPPFASMTFAWANGRLVEYTDLRFRNPWPEGRWDEQAGLFPHPAVAGLSARQYADQRDELLALYDELFDRLASGAAFSTSFTAEFSRRLRLLVEPELLPFYRSLAPRFFERFLDTAATPS